MSFVNNNRFTAGAPDTKKQARGNESATRLLRAAETLFREKGVESTTVNDIIQLAGIAKGTFYHHFPSRAALLMALREHVIASFNAQIIDAVNAHPAHALWPRLEAWILACVEGSLKMEEVHDVVFGNDPLRWNAEGWPFMAELISLIDTGKATGIFSAEQPRITATFIFRGIIGVIDDYILSGKPAYPLAETLYDLARNLLIKK